MCAQTRLDLGLYSHLREFWGMESEPMLTPREKSPLLEAQRRVETATLHHAGQPAQRTTDWAIPASPNGQCSCLHSTALNTSGALLPLKPVLRFTCCIDSVELQVLNFNLKNGHIRQNLTPNGEPRRSSCAMQKKIENWWWVDQRLRQAIVTAAGMFACVRVWSYE